MANLCTAFLGGALAGVDNAVLSFWHSVALSCGSFFTPFMEFVSVFGKGGIFPICLCVFLMLFKDTRKVGVAGLLAVGVGALFTNVILKPLIADNIIIPARADHKENTMLDFKVSPHDF